ncbi:MAG: hypothetical protein ACLQQ4_09320 [Bacteroidia bacterium]
MKTLFLSLLVFTIILYKPVSGQFIVTPISGNNNQVLQLGQFIALNSTNSPIEVLPNAILKTKSKSFNKGTFSFSITSNYSEQQKISEYSLQFQFKGNLMGIASGSAGATTDNSSYSDFINSQIIISASIDSSAITSDEGTFDPSGLKNDQIKMINSSYPYYIQEIDYGKTFYMFVQFNDRTDKSVSNMNINVKGSVTSGLSSAQASMNTSEMNSYFSSSKTATIKIVGIGRVTTNVTTQVITSLAELDNCITEFQNMFNKASCDPIQYIVQDCKTLGGKFNKSSALDNNIPDAMVCLYEKYQKINSIISRLKGIDDLHNQCLGKKNFMPPGWVQNNNYDVNPMNAAGVAIFGNVNDTNILKAQFMTTPPSGFPKITPNPVVFKQLKTQYVNELRGGKYNYQLTFNHYNSILTQIEDTIRKDLNTNKWDCIDNTSDLFPTLYDSLYLNMINYLNTGYLQVPITVFSESACPDRINDIFSGNFNLYYKSDISFGSNLVNNGGSAPYNDCAAYNWKCQDANHNATPCMNFQIELKLINKTTSEVYTQDWSVDQFPVTGEIVFNPSFHAIDPGSYEYHLFFYTLNKCDANESKAHDIYIGSGSYFFLGI